MLPVTETEWLPTLCMAGIILLFSVTDDISSSLFYKILIRDEIAELAKASCSYLQLVVASG